LQATGYIKGQPMAGSTVASPGKPYKIILKADYSGKPFTAEGNDAIFVYAYVTDENGTVIPGAVDPIQFSVTGPGKIIGENPVKAEAGIAPILIMGAGKPGKIVVSTSAEGLASGDIELTVH